MCGACAVSAATSTNTPPSRGGNTPAKENARGVDPRPRPAVGVRARAATSVAAVLHSDGDAAAAAGFGAITACKKRTDRCSTPLLLGGGEFFGFKSGSWGHGVAKMSRSRSRSSGLVSSWSVDFMYSTRAREMRALFFVAILGVWPFLALQ